MEAALNGPLGRTILEPAVLTIGSSPDNQLVLHDANVAEYQAEIRPEGQGYSITDLGSGSGTFVNGQRLEWDSPRLLNPGDSITIGGMTFTYEADGMLPPQANPGQMQRFSQEDAGRQGVEVGQSGFEAGRLQGSPLQGYADRSDLWPAASPGAEHTAYGSTVPEEMQPEPGQMYPASPFVPPTYPGNVPAYPGAAAVYAEPAPPQPVRRGRAWIWITLVVVVLVLLIAGGAAFVFFSRSTPEKTLDSYCQALQAQNYVAAYNQLANSIQNMESEPQYAAIAQALGKTTACTHGSASVITNTATANLTVVSAGQTYNGTVTLLQDNSNNWKISILLSSPAMTLNTFCNALKIGDYPTAYSALSSDLKGRVAESQFETDFAGLTCSYSGILVSGINAAATATFQDNTGASTTGAFTLREDHNSN
ncbi:MAG TPA: FHA domain-containing protein, partial [Ktedonobacteraceae bacterium]|nr:FHA domain-containing protein [Ktedonobacteraceae bacterium]